MADTTGSSSARHIVLAASVVVAPIWDVRSGSELEPWELPISLELQRTITSWAHRIDDVDAEWTAAQTNDFIAAGFGIAEQLQRTLGAEFAVHYFRNQSGPEVLSSE